MNTKRVNGAAGVILAALQQNRTAAGIALALESAGLLMTPETAEDMASTANEAVALLDKAVAELKREHAEAARLRERIAELEGEQPADGITRRIAPTQALSVPEPGACTECGDGPSKWCGGCAKCSCEPKHDKGCAYAGALQ